MKRFIVVARSALSFGLSAGIFAMLALSFAMTIAGGCRGGVKDFVWCAFGLLAVTVGSYALGRTHGSRRELAAIVEQTATLRAMNEVLDAFDKAGLTDARETLAAYFLQERQRAVAAEAARGARRATDWISGDTPPSKESPCR